MLFSRRSPLVVAALLAALAAACGGGSGSPVGPSDDSGVILIGTVVGGSSTTSSVRSLSSAGVAGTLTVTVQENPAITVTVGPSGTFTLRGLPAGSFSLVFSLDGVVIATLPFSGVNPNQEITITVSLDGTVLTLLEQKRNGIGHGDVELEGLVDQVVAVDPAGESRFVIAGQTVVARPGDTAVREGGSGRSVTDVTVGRRVHVKGVWLTPEAKGQPVLAWEIKLQGPQGSPTPAPVPAPAGCPSGPNTQVEGIIQSKAASSIVVRQQGKGDFDCAVTSATRIRKGNTSFTFAELQPGWRVHVSGNGMGASGSLCLVQADEIKVQQQ